MCKDWSDEKLLAWAKANIDNPKVQAYNAYISRRDPYGVWFQVAGSKADGSIGETGAINYPPCETVVVPQTQTEIQAALINELELQRLAAAEAANQLALKTSMLQSETATWQSQDVYSIALADTNKAIDVFNNVTLSDLAEKTALTEQILSSLPSQEVPKTDREQLILDRNNMLIITIITVIIFIFILKR